MISIDRTYQTCLMLANSDVRGNIKPRDLRLAIYDACNEIYESYFPEKNRQLNRQNKGLVGAGLENTVDKLDEKIQHFLVEDAELTFASPYWELPANYRYIDTVTCDGSEVEFYSNSRDFKLVTNFADTQPSIENPIGLLLQDKIRISPSDADSEVTMSYLRTPVLPNWTFQVLGGVEVFNPSAADFRDIDLHNSEENNVIIKTLFRFGINLKEQDIVAITQQRDNINFNQDNAV